MSGDRGTCARFDSVCRWRQSDKRSKKMNAADHKGTNVIFAHPNSIIALHVHSFLKVFCIRGNISYICCPVERCSSHTHTHKHTHTCRQHPRRSRFSSDFRKSRYLPVFSSKCKSCDFQGRSAAASAGNRPWGLSLNPQLSLNLQPNSSLRPFISEFIISCFILIARLQNDCGCCKMSALLDLRSIEFIRPNARKCMQPLTPNPFSAALVT